MNAEINNNKHASSIAHRGIHIWPQTSWLGSSLSTYSCGLQFSTLLRWKCQHRTKMGGSLTWSCCWRLVYDDLVLRKIPKPGFGLRLMEAHNSIIIWMIVITFIFLIGSSNHLQNYESWIFRMFLFEICCLFWSV